MKKIFLCLLVGTQLISCKEAIQEETKETYIVTSPIKVDTSFFSEYVAEINAVQNVEIRARVNGYLEKIHIDEGKYVKEGQLLFSINNREYNEELMKTNAILKSMEGELYAFELEAKNTKQLVERNVVSKIEYEFAKNKVRIAQAKVEEARANWASAKIKLSNSEIRAPFSGIVNRIPHKIGSLIAEGTLLTSISENDEVFAYFDLSEREYLNFIQQDKKKNANREVTLMMANGQMLPYKGVIETIEGEIDEKTGNIAFRARFKNTEKLLKHGASGRIRLENELKNVLIVPQKSTYEIQDKIFVYTVDKDGKVKAQNIKSDQRIPHYYIVKSGLSANDKIVYEGIQLVKDGMLIDTQFQSIKELMKK